MESDAVSRVLPAGNEIVRVLGISSDTCSLFPHVDDYEWNRRKHTTRAAGCMVAFLPVAHAPYSSSSPASSISRSPLTSPSVSTSRTSSSSLQSKRTPTVNTEESGKKLATSLWFRVPYFPCPCCTCSLPTAWYPHDGAKGWTTAVWMIWTTPSCTWTIGRRRTRSTESHAVTQSPRLPSTWRSYGEECRRCP